MQILPIQSRSVLFRFLTKAGWYLNIHLIKGDRHNFVIDTGLGKEFIEPVKAYLINQDKPVIVINTHHHWDHIWGNNFLSESMCISHVQCRDLILSKWNEMTDKHGSLISGDIKMRLPELVFEQEIYFPEDAVRVFYTPGHTIDSISVLDEKDGVMNAGDNIGDSDEEILPSLNCDPGLYKHSLKKYTELDFDICLSGHNTEVHKKTIDRIAELMGGY